MALEESADILVPAGDPFFDPIKHRDSGHPVQPRIL